LNTNSTKKLADLEEYITQIDLNTREAGKLPKKDGCRKLRT